MNFRESGGPTTPQKVEDSVTTEQMELDGFESKYMKWEEIKSRPSKDPETGDRIRQGSLKEEAEATISNLHEKLEQRKFISYEELDELMFKVRWLYMLNDKNEWTQFVTGMRRAYADFDLSPRQKMEMMIDLINSVASRGKHREG